MINESNADCLPENVTDDSSVHGSEGSACNDMTGCRDASSGGETGPGPPSVSAQGQGKELLNEQVTLAPQDTVIPYTRRWRCQRLVNVRQRRVRRAAPCQERELDTTDEGEDMRGGSHSESNQRRR